MGSANTIILGGGMTGLAAGMVSGHPVYEAESVPGGICSSYYMAPGTTEKLYKSPEDGEAYRFEIGGGHWIFGGDPAVLNFIRTNTPVKSYNRSSAVFFSKTGVYVPYPIQNHLSFLGKDISTKVIHEILNTTKGVPNTMEEWLSQSFGPTLMDMFFAPFHELYTAGMWTEIAPQDAYKSPVSIADVVKGALEEVPPVGYNISYLYPEEGLNTLAARIAEKSDMRYGRRVSRIDTKKKEVQFDDGAGDKYDRLISTLPLPIALAMSSVETDQRPDCYTSVLVLNIGAKKGTKCPKEHWLYVADSDSKFHRVGFYSNVDSSFLPASSHKDEDRVSIYVERAYRQGNRPSEAEVAAYSKDVVAELQSWGYITDAEIVDPTWIEVAYTWSWPGSKWKPEAIKALENEGVFQIGRYGRWIFQGIAESIQDGFFIGGAFK